MSDSIVCPVCQHKNQPDAIQCANCAAPLNLGELGDRSTLRVSEKLVVPPQKTSRCAEYALNLPQDTLVLFVMSEPEPIIVQATQSITIGRRAEGSTAPFVDLASFGAAILGVSRQHVEISYREGAWTIMDLDSTNGTWLNRVRLNPHHPYELQNNDNIWLGHLKLSVCFGSGIPIAETQLSIRDTSSTLTSQLHLTLHYLRTQIIPFLEAIAEINQICQECRGTIVKEIYINTIGAKDGLVVATLTGVGDDIEIIYRWLAPWRKQLLSESGAEDPKPSEAPQRELVQVGKEILADVAPELTHDEMAAYLERMLRPLSFLATTPLELDR